uniref:Galectin n=1 Tax=Bursaphelenchus xylophilus TaxID=6326 RepID=A0A1I7RUD6_BURXY
MLSGRVFILIFTYAIVQIECNSTQWAAEYQLPYQLNFTDNRRFEIGCVLVAYLRLPEYAQINLIDKSDNVNFHISIRYFGIVLNSQTFGKWGDEVDICYGPATRDECTNHGDISEVIIERVEGGYNVIMNGKRRNEAVFPDRLRTDPISVLVKSCVVVAYLRLPEYAQIHLIDRSGNTFGRWGAAGVICYEKAILDECTNHGDISEVIIERVEGGYNVIMNGKRRNEAVFPNGDEGFMGTEADSVLVRSETGKNFDVTGITVLCPDPPEL